MNSLLLNLDLREPAWLWLAAYPWLLWSIRWLMDRPRGAHYADAELLPWVTANTAHRFKPQRLWRHSLFVICWLLFAVSMTGPRLPEYNARQDESAFTELMLVLDVSRSMTARDILPSRLERARLELYDLLARTEKMKTGLLVYSARPHLLSPPTTDKAILRHYLQLIQHGLLPTEGSNLNDALKFALNSFSSTKSSRVILLITDGEIPSGQASEKEQLEHTVVELRKQGVSLYALGIGTVEGAPLVSHDGGWLRYQDKAVISRLDEELLHKLVDLGGGRYSSVSDTDREWQYLYDQAIARSGLNNITGEVKSDIVWQELYSWFLLPAIVLLILSQWQLRRPMAKSLPVLILLSSVVTGLSQPAPALAAGQNWQLQAHQAYRNNNFIAAKQHYARIAGYAGRMGEGSSAYRLGEYRHAIQQFTQAVLDANDDQQRASALFNLANCHYKLDQFQAAMDIYQDVLRYTPQNSAATVNLAYAKALHRQQKNAAPSKSTRAGRGPRMGKLPDGTDVSRSDVAIDESENNPPQGVQQNITLAPGAGKDLIDKGIHQAQPAAKKITAMPDTQWQYDPTGTERISALLESMQVDESVIWKRIFETEEAFHAPTDLPVELPGVEPW